MQSTLSVSGMPELNLTGLATTDTVGGSASTVQSACENLYAYADNLKTFIENLETQEQQILKGWEGTAADTLEQQFPGLIEAFNQIPPAIRSLADWASSTMNSYTKLDEDTASTISQILGGGK